MRLVAFNDIIDPSIFDHVKVIIAKCNNIIYCNSDACAEVYTRIHINEKFIEDSQVSLQIVLYGENVDVVLEDLKTKIETLARLRENWIKARRDFKENRASAKDVYKLKKQYEEAFDQFCDLVRESHDFLHEIIAEW